MPQALQRHTRQEAARAIGEAPAWPYSSGAEVGQQARADGPLETNNVEAGRRPKPVSVRRGRG